MHRKILYLVAGYFEDKIKNDCISVEDIQDSVEKVLSDAGYADVAKSYILYRKQREKLMDDLGIEYREIYADDEPGLAEKYNILTVPVLIRQSDGEKLTGYGPIRAFLMGQQRKVG